MLASKWSFQKQQQRSLSVHEYLSMRILEDLNIKVPKGKVAKTPEEAFLAAQELRKSATCVHLSPLYLIQCCNTVQ